ncbi:MAG: hypothetical protein QOG99_3603, partial [Frankiales bacterium]|nr:hypothetical protein [Frankiales bacterium]
MAWRWHCGRSGSRTLAGFLVIMAFGGRQGVVQRVHADASAESEAGLVVESSVHAGVDPAQARLGLDRP